LSSFPISLSFLKKVLGFSLPYRFATTVSGYMSSKMPLFGDKSQLMEGEKILADVLAVPFKAFGQLMGIHQGIGATRT
jgi:hypothetical protein